MTILNPVIPGEALSAVKENQKIQTINNLSERLDSLYIPAVKNNGIICTILNDSGDTVTTGSPLAVSGIRNRDEKDKLISLYHSSGIQLNGESVTASSDIIAFCLEAGKDGKLVRCFLPATFGGLVTVKDDNHKYAKPKRDGLETAGYGPFKIIGTSTRPTDISSESDYDGFAILQYNLSGGHIVGVVQTDVSYNVKSDVTVGSLIIEDIGCPLLRQGESISAGSTVIMSWNPIAGELQIIESQCSGDEEE